MKFLIELVYNGCSKMHNFVEVYEKLKSVTDKEKIEKMYIILDIMKELEKYLKKKESKEKIKIIKYFFSNENKKIDEQYIKNKNIENLKKIFEEINKDIDFDLEFTEPYCLPKIKFKNRLIQDSIEEGILEGSDIFESSFLQSPNNSF